MIRVLSVEDEPDLQRLRALTLADQDFELHYAFNGPQGLAKAQALKPHVVLVDLMLPGYDGRELVRRLKDDPATADVPVIVTTAYSGSATFGEAEIAKLGVAAYLAKPVAREELIDTIRRVAAAPEPRRVPR